MSYSVVPQKSDNNFKKKLLFSFHVARSFSTGGAVCEATWRKPMILPRRQHKYSILWEYEEPPTPHNTFYLLEGPKLSFNGITLVLVYGRLFDLIWKSKLANVECCLHWALTLVSRLSKSIVLCSEAEICVHFCLFRGHHPDPDLYIDGRCYRW